MTCLLVDGVCFQRNAPGPARVWGAVLKRLAASGTFEILFLDRGWAPEIEGVEYIPFAKNLLAHSAADSLLIQQVCDHFGVDVFASTHYTSPVSTSALIMVQDMIPELFGFGPSHRTSMEKAAAISFAQRYLCLSHTTRSDLLTFFPEIPRSHVVVAHCGVDPELFHPQEPECVADFRWRYSLDRPYFLLVGSRVQHNAYKNGPLFFESLAGMPTTGFDVLCVGGEPEIGGNILRSLPEGTRCRRLKLTDEELSQAYAGASALVYPSLYEGSGLPVLEAMACGCPVITTPHGSLSEVAGDAAHLISGASVEEMRQALARLQDERYRQELRRKGIAHAHRFRWEPMAQALGEQLETLAGEGRSGVYSGFFSQWRRLREAQASVDHVLYPA